MREAQLYQHMYGGRINIIKQFEKEEEADESDDEFSFDEEEAPDEDQCEIKRKYHVVKCCIPCRFEKWLSIYEGAFTSIQ